jgi:hypothetical protein
MTQAMTVRLPDDLHELLRRESFTTRQPMSEIITEGLRLRLRENLAAQYADLCALFEAAWHHAVPESLDELAPVTSKEARSLATLAIKAMTQ